MGPEDSDYEDLTTLNSVLVMWRVGREESVVVSSSEGRLENSYLYGDPKGLY